LSSISISRRRGWGIMGGLCLLNKIIIIIIMMDPGNDGEGRGISRRVKNLLTGKMFLITTNTIDKIVINELMNTPARGEA
jgi:hypothetical protein